MCLEGFGSNLAIYVAEHQNSSGEKDSNVEQCLFMNTN